MKQASDLGPARTLRLAGHLGWAVVIAVVEYRTAWLRIVVHDDRVVAHGVLWNRTVPRRDLRYIDLNVPTRGEFTPGGGESVMAVLDDGKRVTLSDDRARSADKHFRHYADLARALNVRLGTGDTSRAADDGLPSVR